MQLARWVNYEPALGQAVRAKEGEDAPSAVGRGVDMALTQVIEVLTLPPIV